MFPPGEASTRASIHVGTQARLSGRNSGSLSLKQLQALFCCQGREYIGYIKYSEDTNKEKNENKDS